MLSRCALVTNLCLGLFLVLGLPEIKGLFSFLIMVETNLYSHGQDKTKNKR